MSYGLVYILTNPSFKDWIKIGCTDCISDINSLMKDINSKRDTPCEFECKIIYEVESAESVKNKILELLVVFADAANKIGKEDTKKSENGFIKMSVNDAYRIISIISDLRGDPKRLKKRGDLCEDFTVCSSKKNRTTFSMLNIAVGEQVVFYKDDSISAEVVDNINRLKYKGRTYSVTELAQKIRKEKYGKKINRINGWTCFKLNGILLSNLRKDLENQQ